ncbi:hypothetical protein LOK46_20145 [Methylobacterium sp. NMS14P]|uniref:hypothetical protein n=1 Tax=Methylobacterium sp. NMS14P TaxID=2894310 RepID=UPI0023584795|nr:hypothetical protein [Methylobacterium sp. NMS14P]WCS23467.1 hypothetical protein LOK46_20145 [Methylobacterium sp. NMS14P]
MHLWSALRRLLPLLAVISLALTPVTAPAAIAGPHAPMAAPAHDHRDHHHAAAPETATESGDTGMMADMDAMPCCPKPAKPDCAKGCPLMALCLAGMASLLPAAITLPVPTARGLSTRWPEGAAFASRPGAPLPEPPRA